MIHALNIACAFASVMTFIIGACAVYLIKMTWECGDWALRTLSVLMLMMCVVMGAVFLGAALYA